MRFVRILLFSIFIANTSAAEAFETSSVRLRATFRLPSADGYARITRVAGGVHIQAEFSDMKPASLFGGDYNTYVFWGITDRGVSVNLGELLLVGDKSELDVTTKTAISALVITAEPHFLVAAPSRFVVLEYSAEGGPVEFKPDEARYNYERDTLAKAPEAGDPVPTGLQQAWTAVLLAQRAKADELASSEMGTANAALDELLKLSKQGEDRLALDEQARGTVRLAVAAQRKAREEEIAQLSRAGREARASAKAGAAGSIK